MKHTIITSKLILYVWDIYDKRTQIKIATETMQDACPANTSLGMVIRNARRAALDCEKRYPTVEVKYRVIGA